MIITKNTISWQDIIIIGMFAQDIDCISNKYRASRRPFISILLVSSVFLYLYSFFFVSWMKDHVELFIESKSRFLHAFVEHSNVCYER